MNQFSETDYEVLRAFLEQYDQFHFVDKHFFNRNLVTEFTDKYRYHQAFLKNADSICENSIDIESRKIYCPMADTFSIYGNLLSEGELEQMQKGYDADGNREVLKVDSLISTNSRLKKHSEQYYKSIKYGEMMAPGIVSETPSIRILNLYYNENKSVAIVAYSIFNDTSKSGSNYMMLKKMDNLWWKPMGVFVL